MLNPLPEPTLPLVTFTARIRFIGQEHTLSIPYRRDDTADMFFDRFSSAHLERFGYQVLRFPNEELFADLPAVLDRICRAAAAQE